MGVLRVPVVKNSELPKLEYGFYKYKGRGYRYLGTTNTKCINSGDWYWSVVYIDEKSDFGTCSREITDFLCKFEGIDLKEYSVIDRRNNTNNK